MHDDTYNKAAINIVINIMIQSMNSSMNVAARMKLKPEDPGVRIGPLDELLRHGSWQRQAVVNNIPFEGNIMMMLVVIIIFYHHHRSNVHNHHHHHHHKTSMHYDNRPANPLIIVAPSSDRVAMNFSAVSGAGEGGGDARGVKEVPEGT